MMYAEASYFDGYHFQHIAAYEDDRRLRAILKRERAILRENAARLARQKHQSDAAPGDDQSPVSLQMRPARQAIAA